MELSGMQLKEIKDKIKLEIIRKIEKALQIANLKSQIDPFFTPSAEVAAVFNLKFFQFPAFKSSGLRR